MIASDLRRPAPAARLARAAAAVALALFGLALPARPAAAADPAAVLKTLVGTYLGKATVKDLPSGRTEERDIDVEIAATRGGGFRVHWINVTLVDGRRDQPGVKRRVSEGVFKPAKGKGFFVEAPESNIFAEREEVTPMGGNPVRWAVLDDTGLHVYALVVLDDGRYELQTYSRRKTSRGLDLHYERVVDGELVRTIDGRAVKVE